MAGKLPIWDERMLQLMNFVIANNIKNCNSQALFCKVIGADAATIAQVRKNASSFRHKHVLAACKKFNVTADYIYGLSNTMLNTNKVKYLDAVGLLQEALRIIKKQ